MSIGIHFYLNCKLNYTLKSNILKYIFLALFFLAPYLIKSQSKPNSTGLISKYELDEIIIESDLFQNKKIDFAGSVTGLNIEKITIANNLYLQPLLNTIPGVHMQSGALNTNRITIRGIGSRSPFSTNKIKAYLDDIPLSTGEGETNLEDIDFATLGGIEVYRGPVSTMYGAGLGGAIHMRTKNPANTNLIATDFSIGSFGLQKFNLKTALSDGQKGISIFYQKVRNDGYRENNEYLRQSISAIGGSNIGSTSSLTSYINFTHLKAFIPSSLDLETFTNNPREATNSWATAMGFEHNDRLRLGLSLKTVHSKQMESTIAVFSNIGKTREVTPFGNEDIESNNFGLRARIRSDLLNNEKLILVAGTEAFIENFGIKSFENDNSQNGNLTSDLEQDRKYGNLFIATEFFPSQKWKLSLGSNLNLSSYKNTDLFNQGLNNTSGNQNFDPIISPKFSITRKLKSQISIYGLVAHGFSLPTFDETLNPNGQINESIMSEQGLNIEFGLKGYLLKEKLYTEFSIYSMEIKNLLVARRNSELDFSGFNAGKSQHNGIELSLNHNLLESKSTVIRQSLNYTLMDYTFDVFIDDDRGDFSGNELTGVPNQTLNYQLTFESKLGIYSNVNYQYVGAMPILDDNSIYSTAYKTINLKAGFKRQYNQFYFDVYGGVNNLLDEKYASMIQINPRFNQRYYYPGLPINYYTSIKIAYKI